MPRKSNLYLKNEVAQGNYMKSSSLSFNNFGLGGKLVSIVAITTLLMVSILMGISSYAVTDILESTTKKEMHLDNQVVFGMLNLIEKSRKQQTENTIKSLNAEFNGKFTIDGSKINLDDKVLPNLFYEGESISGNTSIIKSTNVRTSELVAILAKSGDEFVWVNSTYKEEKGGLGTVLDRNHPIFTALNSGEGYFGSQTLFGKNYLSRYQPIKNSTGQVIGAFLSAIDVSDQVLMLKEEVKTLKIGNEGYVYIMESNGKDTGKLISHPTSEGKNLFETKDSHGFFS
jgi:methyl-accepting chemotaxis protein